MKKHDPNQKETVKRESARFGEAQAESNTDAQCAEAQRPVMTIRLTLPALFQRSKSNRLHSCARKTIYYSPLQATRAAYHLEETRPGESFDVCPCRWCGFYHIGHSSFFFS